MLTWLTATISVVSRRRWPRLTSSGTNRGQSAVTYRTSQGTYFVFHNDAGAIRAYKITPTNPPAIVFAWSASQSGQGSPWVTTTDGTNNAIVWVVGARGDQRLHGYNGDTGAVIYAGGGTNELMTGTRSGTRGIVARGRIYVACGQQGVCVSDVPARNTYAYTYPVQRLRQRLRDCYSDSTATATATPTSTPTATATATSNSQLPQPPLQAVRHRHPDQPPLRDPMRHRGRARLRRQGPRFNRSIYRLSVVRGPDKRIIITTGMAPIHDRIL